MAEIDRLLIFLVVVLAVVFLHYIIIPEEVVREFFSKMISEATSGSLEQKAKFTAFLAGVLLFYVISILLLIELAVSKFYKLILDDGGSDTGIIVTISILIGILVLIAIIIASNHYESASPKIQSKEKMLVKSINDKFN